MKPQFEIYKREDGEWGWRFKGRNGKILAIGGEGITRKDDCERSVDTLCDDLATAVPWVPTHTGPLKVADDE